MAEIDLYGKRILVVDDEPFVRNLIVRTLSEFGGPQIDAADDGREALSMLAHNSYQIDLALFDFNMPVMNGLALLKAVRVGASHMRRELPIGMLTGHADTALVQTALALDVNAFLVKPTSAAVLANRIERMLSEEPIVQSVAHYLAIDVPGWKTEWGPLEEDMPEPEPTPEAAQPVAAAPQAKVQGYGPKLQMRIEDVPAGAMLAEDIMSKTGIYLLRNGVRLTPRFLSRLRDISELEEIEYVWVRVLTDP